MHERHLKTLLALPLLLAAGAQAQTATPAATPNATATPAAPAASAAQPSPAPQQRIEITGGRRPDVDERRLSTAAKIIIGRDEIDKFGDATVGEVLRRLPGVTTPGAPGRGGPPRMRGLGNGFTQLLIDGQRVAPGFGIESLTPEQIERIEILRAPTAETGSQAIAGTINIITREGYRRRLNDVRIGLGLENGQLAPGATWTHNDSIGALIYNGSGSLFAPRRHNRNTTRTSVTDLANNGALLEDRSSRSVTQEQRYGINLSGRLQWRLGAEGSGDQLSLSPTLFHTDGQSHSDIDIAKALVRGSAPSLYDSGRSDGDNRYTNARLGLQWRQRVGDLRLEANGGGGSYRAVSNSSRSELTLTGAQAGTRLLQDHADTRENAVNLTLKASGVAGGDASTLAGGHNLVGGVEVDASQRSENKTSLQNGQALLADFGDTLQARALRTAAFVQDEWAINPGWSTQAGLRWEGIATRGDNGAAASEPNPSNRSSVWTPLFHAVWKPDPKKRDQLRLSLTRSYRAPALGTLMARPSINRDYAPAGANTVTSPDSIGNPALRPELARGIDLAFERYLEGGGVLSANLFARDISGLMRGVTTLRSVSYSPQQRYVRQMQNIGDASTRGIELDGKFRLDQAIAAAPGIEMRANLAFYDSKVKAVPGPDNRLDQQAKASANIGADYRLRGLPLSLGGNLNWVPGYTTRTDADQTASVSTKRVWDAYALWTLTPAVALRLLGSNLVPRDYTSTTTVEQRGSSANPASNERSTVSSSGPSYVNWQLRLELKL